MKLSKIKLENFRNIANLSLDPANHFNLFLGENGAGKTSILEAISIIGRGKSFRTSRVNECIQKECKYFRIYLELNEPSREVNTEDKISISHKIGYERNRNEWLARANGQDIKKVSELAHLLPLTIFEPNSQNLISGTPDYRRRFIDWGLFHVEHNFLNVWKNHDRILKQRNSALRNQASERIIRSMDKVYLASAIELHKFREQYVESLKDRWTLILPLLAPGLSGLEFELKQGWKQGESLEESLNKNLEYDRQQGSTRYGVHRDDLSLNLKGVKAQNLLSRGQQKISALMLILCQLNLWQQKLSHKPTILLDDLNSELDEAHCIRVLDWLHESKLQTWMTAVNWPDSLMSRIESEQDKVFHVEQGKAAPVL